MIFCVTIIYLSVDENKAKEVTCLIVKILLFDESLQLWFQVLMLGIIEHQTFISFLERYNCMVFACSKAINLIRMISQDDSIGQHSKVSQRKILLCKRLIVIAIPSCPDITRIIVYKKRPHNIIHASSINHRTMEREYVIRKILLRTFTLIAVIILFLQTL